MTDYVVAAAGDLDEGERLTVQLEGREVTVFNVEGDYVAYNNWCLHQSGPVCEGVVSGTEAATFDRESLEVTVALEREGRVLNCPWHGWQYDLTTGECLSRRHVQLPAYPVDVVDGDLVVTL